MMNAMYNTSSSSFDWNCVFWPILLFALRYIDKICYTIKNVIALICMKVAKISCNYLLHLPISANVKFGPRLPMYLSGVCAVTSPKF